MSIDSLATWKSTFASLPLVDDGTWSTNISNWVFDRVDGKAQVTNVTHATPPLWFDKATFKSELDKLPLTDNKATGSSNFADAWKTAIDSSTLTTVAGDSIVPGGAANTWSVVNNSVIDSSSRTSARNQMETDLNNAALVDDVANSEFPKIIRDAFLNLTCSIDGLDSQVPPTGPLPLSISVSPLI